MTAKEGGFVLAKHATSTHVREKVDKFIHVSVANQNFMQHQFNNVTEKLCPTGPYYTDVTTNEYYKYSTRTATSYSTSNVYAAVTTIF